MAKSSKQSFVQSVGNFAAQISHATGAGGKVTLFTVGSERGDDEELRALQISNTDAAAIVVNFYVQMAGSSVEVLVGSVSAAAGTTTDCRNTVAAVLICRPVMIGAGRWLVLFLHDQAADVGIMLLLALIAHLFGAVLGAALGGGLRAVN
ncbi:hypothetical protein [Xylella fastidiosa]|uniref:hypothetical protein n=1 Tax=Xylella fastidiosa TaxID=2371 RepID=UPI001E48FC40|nr:hypothetical protein [Xylella fastidiosa]